MAHLVTLIQALLQRHVSFRSLSDGAIDTTTASGELVFHIFSALAQFERRLIQERTHAGLAVARARGKKGGRIPRRAEEPRVRMAYTMYKDQSLTVQDICRVLRISQATFYRYVALGRRAAEATERRTETSFTELGVLSLPGMGHASVQNFSDAPGKPVSLGDLSAGYRYTTEFVGFLAFALLLPQASQAGSSSQRLSGNIFAPLQRDHAASLR
jgi:hypothetical protein